MKINLKIFLAYIVILNFLFSFVFGQSDQTNTSEQITETNATAQSTQTNTSAESTDPNKPVQVDAYQKKDGTNVKAHNRSLPNSPSAKKDSLVKKTFKPKDSGSKYTPKSPKKSDARPMEMNVDKDSTIVYFNPPEISVEEGESFSTPIVINNPKIKPFNTISFIIKYDPDALMVEGIVEKNLKPYLKQHSEKLLYQKIGIIKYWAEFNSPINPTYEKLITLNWKAKTATAYTQISFTSYEDKKSFIKNNKTDILGSRYIKNDGFISAGLVINPKSDDSSASFYDEIYKNKMPTLSDSAAEGVEIQLRTSQQVYKVEDIFEVEIFLNNSKQTMIDSINLKIEFDPKYLQVMDFDDDNWIKRDINIYDGGFHEDFPFDYQIQNQANNDKGEIIYHNGFSYMTIPPSGILAIIKFQAISPTNELPIKFKVPKDAFDRATSVSYLGKDILGDPLILDDGIGDVAINIEEEK